MTKELVGSGIVGFLKEIASNQAKGNLLVEGTGVKRGMRTFICEVEETGKEVKLVGEEKLFNILLVGSSFSNEIYPKLVKLQDEGWVVTGGGATTTRTAFVKIQKCEKEVSSQTKTSTTEKETEETETPVVDEESVEEYTEETLNEMEFKELKKLGNEKFGVTGRSKDGLIEDILKAQAEQE